MTTKRIKTSKKANEQKKSVRIQSSVADRADLILKNVNNKKYGRKVKLDHLLNLLLDLVTDEHIHSLQKKSLTYEDQKEQLRLKYIEKFGNISKDDFIGFMLTKEFVNFKSEHESVLNFN